MKIVSIYSMKGSRCLFNFFLIWILCVTTYSQKAIVKELQWYTDFEKAKIISQKGNKAIILRFQGSDWCSNCWRLDSTLFETKQFVKFVGKKFVLVALDFPSKPENKLPIKIALKNNELLKVYNPKGTFPALIVLNSNGDIIEKMSVNANSTEWYINELRKITQKVKKMNN